MEEKTIKIEGNLNLPELPVIIVEYVGNLKKRKKKRRRGQSKVNWKERG